MIPGESLGLVSGFGASYFFLGLFVGLLAPYAFKGYYEFPIGLGLCAALVVIVLLRRQTVAARQWMRIRYWQKR